jgi:hypothetical protein
MPLPDADLGNVGVQRRVLRYRTRYGGTWAAELDCGHSVDLEQEPPGGEGEAGPGRYRDCPTCTYERREGIR